MSARNTILKTSTMLQCRRQGVGGQGESRGPEPDFLGSITICRLHKLTLSDQFQVTLQLTVNLSDLVHRFLASPPLGGGGRGRIRCQRPCHVVRITRRRCDNCSCAATSNIFNCCGKEQKGPFVKILPLCADL
jgi:hypothetical protein